MHYRRTYLLDLRTQLLTITGFAGVWIQRISPSRTAFPSITLFADQETLVTETIHSAPRPQDRRLMINVRAWVRGVPDTEKAENDMDAAALAIEQKLRKPSGTDDMILMATDFGIDETDPEVHAVTLTYQIQYQSTEFLTGL
jgi:hypothetical protein